MSQVSEVAPAEGGQQRRVSFGGLLQALEIDLRLLGMALALVVIFLVFGIVTGGKFLQAVNFLNLLVQTASIAIIATGMVLVIVSRNIDLSVGSIVGVVGMTLAVLMAKILPQVIGYDSPFMWIIALAAGLALGGLLGGFQGFIIAYIGVPSFVVTLGGLLAFRGLSWAITQGVTIGPVDPVFKLLGGGPLGSIGGPTSWVVGIVACLAIVALLVYNRRQRQRFGFPLRPVWAEALLGVIGSVVVLGLVAYSNAYLWPPGIVKKFYTQHGLVIPEGGVRVENGIPWPVLVVVFVVIGMSFLATRLRYGRHVYSIGGNPEAADLAGINTRWTIMKTFILIGVLCGLSAAIATARLDSATLDLGEGYELYVIAAAVIGGTSLAGGFGSIPGAILGALVIQSLAYGLSFIGLSSPIQDIVAGIVLVIAVGLDQLNRRRAS
jgi:D-xylose transport system permease protein